MAKPGYMHLGEVPEEIFQQELFKYLQRKEESPDAKRVKAQFSYEGKNYTFQKGRSSSGYQIKHSSERVAKEAKRRGLYHDQAVPLSEIEQKMVDNYYEEAQKRGLQVDHKIPIARGGPSNAPWNLGLMNPEDNAAKAERIGGNFKYQPFLADGAVRFPVKAAKFALGPASAIFTAGEAQSRQQVAKEDPTLINKVKAAISTGEAALDAAGLASAATGIGAVATPFFEGGSMVLGFTNMVIEGSEDPAKISTKDRKRFRH